MAASSLALGLFSFFFITNNLTFIGFSQANDSSAYFCININYTIQPMLRWCQRNTTNFTIIFSVMNPT